jgi:hypothetical protein
MMFRTRYPVAMYEGDSVVRDFPSMTHAARFLKVNPQAVKYAAERGTRCRGYRFRFADMPVECQPFNPQVRPNLYPIRARATV